VDRKRVFEGGMKVTRAVLKDLERTGSAARSGSLEGQHLDAKAKEVERGRLTTRTVPDRWFNRAATSEAAARQPMALKAP
jgi:hypothetical protein